MSRPQGHVNLYAVVGRDSFLRDGAIKELVSKFTGAGSGFSITRIDGGSAALADVLDEVRTVSLLGDRRIVVLQDADDFISKYREALERFIHESDVGGVLILAGESLPKTTRLHKALQEQNAVRMLEAPKGAGLVEWVIHRAGNYGKTMDRRTAQAMVEQIGDSLGILDGELNKLAAYAGGRDRVTMEDVDALTGRFREEAVFAVGDAIFAGDAAGALQAWHRVVSTDRAAPGRAIGGLAWNVRQRIQFGEPFGDARRGEMGRGWNRQTESSTRATKRAHPWSVRQLNELQRDLLAADVAVKTGQSTFDVAIEKLIVKHCG